LVAAGFSLRLHRLESLCYHLSAKWYKKINSIFCKESWFFVILNEAQRSEESL
jgi:hypothetical protein